MKKSISSIILILSIFCFAISTSYASSAGTIVNLLMSQLGVTEQQAEGGAGAIFKTAKDNLKTDEYATLTKYMPEISGLANQAAEVKTKSSGWMSSASSLLGDSGKKVENASSLIDSFEKLGMDSSMLSRFTPVILDYAKKNGGDICVKLLQSVL